MDKTHRKHEFFKAIAAAGIEGCCAHGNELHNLFVDVHVSSTRDWRGFGSFLWGVAS